MSTSDTTIAAVRAAVLLRSMVTAVVSGTRVSIGASLISGAKRVVGAVAADDVLGRPALAPTLRTSDAVQHPQ